MLRVALVVATAAIFVAALAAPASAFDDLPGYTIGDTPYTSATPFDVTTPVFDSDGFSEQTAEVNSPNVYLACGGRGAKTAWVRFATAVSGNLRLNVTMSPPGDDVFYALYTAPTASPAFGDLKPLECQDGNNGPEESYIHGHEIPAGRFVFVQVLVQCKPDGLECSQVEREAAQGGPTTVRLRFNPHNADGDSVADTLDRCPAEPGSAALSGCPDDDGDGIANLDDRCAGVHGADTNGCDGDGDGEVGRTNGGPDCDDGNRAIHPGSIDLPGNAVDENCDGHDNPYPRLQNNVTVLAAWSPRLGRTVGFLAPFKVEGPLVKGMTVQLRCQGRICPFSKQEMKVKRQVPNLTIGERFVELRPGAKVTLSILRPGYVGKAMRYTIRQKGRVKVETLCIPAGETNPRRQCA
jgi:Putative metal-binding motif